MLTAWYIAVGLLGAAALALIMRAMVRAYLGFHGTHVVTCPETHAAVGVDVDAAHAALTAALRQPELRVQACSRWPERQHCGQECLAEIAATPHDCLMRTMLTRWYAGRSCAICGRPFGDIAWHDHKPALIGAAGRTIAWPELRAEHLAGVLATHQPVCWDCHVIATFRRRYPELVIDRPAQQAARR